MPNPVNVALIIFFLIMATSFGLSYLLVALELVKRAFFNDVNYLFKQNYALSKTHMGEPAEMSPINDVTNTEVKCTTC